MWVFALLLTGVVGHLEPNKPKIDAIEGQAALQTSGDVTELVRDVQRTMYTNKGENRLFNSVRESIGQAVNTITAETPETPINSLTRGTQSGPHSVFAEGFEQEISKPLREAASQAKIVFHHDGPNPFSDASDKLSELASQAKQGMKGLFSRYVSTPSVDVPKSENFLGGVDDHAPHFFGPGESLVKDTIKSANFNPSDGPLFPNFPGIEQAINYFDESYSAFGNPTEWAKLKAKDAQNPTILERVDKYFKPTPSIPKTAHIESNQGPRLVRFSDLPQPSLSSIKWPTLTPPTQQPVASGSSVQVPVPTADLQREILEDGPRALAKHHLTMQDAPKDLWAWSEARGNPLSTLADKDPITRVLEAKQALEATTDQLKNQQYNIFTDPKYRPDFQKYDLGNLIPNSIGTALGVRPPAADFDQRYDEVLKQALGGSARKQTTIPVPTMQQMSPDAATKLMISALPENLKKKLPNNLPQKLPQGLKEAAASYLNDPTGQNSPDQLIPYVSKSLDEVKSIIYDEYPIAKEIERIGLSEAIRTSMDQMAKQFISIPNKSFQDGGILHVAGQLGDAGTAVTDMISGTLNSAEKTTSTLSRVGSQLATVDPTNLTGATTAPQPDTAPKSPMTSQSQNRDEDFMALPPSPKFTSDNFFS